MTHKSIHIYKWQFDLLKSEYDNLSGIINRILLGNPRVPKFTVDKTDKTLHKVSLNLDDNALGLIKGAENISAAIRDIITGWADQ